MGIIVSNSNLTVIQNSVYDATQLARSMEYQVSYWSPYFTTEQLIKMNNR